MELHKQDTADQVFFYEQDFYVLSNFSSFRLQWKGEDFDTSEHAYQWSKFPHLIGIQQAIQRSRSAHEAFKIAEDNAGNVIPGWRECGLRVSTMRQILIAKCVQHEYVLRKLMATGNRELVEDSWRDNFWGWGPDRNGQNMLGHLWMEIRQQIRAGELYL